MRRYYYIARRWLTFQHYLWFTVECSPGGFFNSPGFYITLKPVICARGLPRRRPRPRRRRLRRFRRRRLAVPLVQRCRRRRSNLIPTLAGLSVPTRRSRRHRRWRGRINKAKQRYWGKSPPIRDYSDTGISNESMVSFCKSTDFLSLAKLFNNFKEIDHESRAKEVVGRYIGHRSSLFLTRVLEAQHNSQGITSDEFKFCPCVWDTGASYGLTPFRSDFIDYEEVHIEVQDIAHTNVVIGVGTVMWKMKATNGQSLYLPLLAYHLREADIRLLSPQTYHQLHGGSSHLVDQGSLVEMKLPSHGPGHPEHLLHIPIDVRNTNLPIVYDVWCTDRERKTIGPHLRSALVKQPLSFQEGFHTARTTAKTACSRSKLGFPRSWNCATSDFDYEFSAFQQMCCPCVGDDANVNLSGPQRELLLWHWKLGCSMSRVQQLMVEHKAVDANNETVIFPQVIKPKFATTSSCPIPLCTSCELAKAKRRNPGVTKQHSVKEREGILSAGVHEVGDMVSTDQFIVKTPGRLPTGFGREQSHNRYHGGTIFNDAHSGIIWVENQVSLGAGETIEAKLRFEEWLYDLALAEVKHYRSDNGVFTAEEFRAECKSKGQSQSYSGVGAQHMNARAERSIQTIMGMARTFMIHVALHWDESKVDDISLWPFAVRHAAWLYNRLPNQITGLTPLEMATGEKANHKDLLRSHVWGCPTFVLDPRLQDGKKIPKWNKRSRLGQFLGFSEAHSSLVANVRHLKTGHVSPQFHVVFDDNFFTVFGTGEKSTVTDAIAEKLWDSNRELFAEAEYDDDGMLVYEPPPLDDVWLTEDERVEAKQRRHKQRERRTKVEKEIEKQIVDKTPHDFSPSPRSPRRSLPDLVPDDDGSSSSDDDSSLIAPDIANDDSDILGIPHESEGEMWDDHPDISPANNPRSPSVSLPEPELPPSPVRPVAPTPSPVRPVSPPAATIADNAGDVTADEPIARRTRSAENPPDIAPNVPREEREPVWVRDDNGRLERRAMNFANMTQREFRHAKAIMSRRDKKQYYASLCVDPPPRVLNIRQSRKRRKYRQRMALKRRKGDEMLNTKYFTKADAALRNATDVDYMFNVGPTGQLDGVDITVESLMNSSLAPFIELAANDCGYRGSLKDLICNWVHPLFLKAKAAASSEDNPNWWQAMNGPFADEFWKAAVTELETLEGMDAWEIVDQTDEMNVIDSTWAFKLKRYPDGLIKKFKARFCARGDQQKEGIDFFETYAPVVQWTTVRLMLILEILLDLKSKQGDVTAAFLHADLEEGEEVYVRMPQGFRKSGKVLKLKKTLYGLRQSPRAFWKFMVEKMQICGMTQSEFDPCLFIGKTVTCIMYVDDLLFWARDESEIHKLAMQLREVGVDLEQEDDAAGFLGVRLERDTDSGLLEMKQTGLIDRVLLALGLDVGMINGKATPAEHAPLTRDEDGPPARGDFHYASVVGMLLYLSGHSRPDITYAVNCAARYMFNPRRSHEEALKRIGRYLKATRDRGLVINPVCNKDGSADVLQISSYPDADFVGLYGFEKPTDPASAKSRTGFTILVADVPVLWTSKLQTETALSTMEAEIVALAHSCKELFPMIDMVGSVGPAFGIPVGDTEMKVSIHEDNAGALILAQKLPPEYTPRSKYYHIKTIWFREEVVKRGIKLLKIETIEQLGDIFTKGLSKVTFEYLRRKLMGW